MANVAAMAAVEIGHPILVLVAVKANDASFHDATSERFCRVSQGRDQGRVLIGEDRSQVDAQAILANIAHHGRPAQAETAGHAGR